MKLADWNASESNCLVPEAIQYSPSLCRERRGIFAFERFEVYSVYSSGSSCCEFPNEDVDQHIIICMGGDTSRKNQFPRNDIVLLWSDRKIEGNFASTRGRISARLCCLFLVQDSSCGIQACLALVQSLIPGPKKQPIGMVTVTEKEP